MNREEMQTSFADFWRRWETVFLEKSANYNEEDDAFADMRAAAKELNLSVETVWRVHVRKHLQGAYRALQEPPDMSNAKVFEHLGDLAIYMGLMAVYRLDAEVLPHDKPTSKQPCLDYRHINCGCVISTDAE